VTSAAETKCEPAALATKYPSLVGKTVRVAQDPQGLPYAFRDPENFESLIGRDTDLVRAALACIGVPFEFKTGSWSEDWWGASCVRTVLPSALTARAW